jgi:sn-glycerol 3-phosphate transport system substrate-binding protein
MRSVWVRWIGRCAAVWLACVLGPTGAEAVVEVQWWHAMPGELGYQLEKLAAEFNASQRDYKVVPVFKGLYSETMLAALYAQRLREHPAIVQVAEIATATMMAARNTIVPVYQLMREEHEPFDPAAYIPAVAGYYADGDGNMLSFPFNSSTPILYYNKDQFRYAGLDPEAPPSTWPELEATAKKIRAAGYPCGFTTHWPSWINVENFSAFHGLQIATRDNGMTATDAELTIDNPTMVKHLAALAAWQRDGIFVYGGRTTRADRKFLTKECAVFLASSATRADILAGANFEVGYGMLPYWPEIVGAPQNSIIGGGSLWVLRDRPAAEYKGVAKFFGYLSRPDVQARWHQVTGYLPITHGAHQLTRDQGFYRRTPGADVSIKQITLNPPLPYTRGLRLGSYVLIRDIIEEEMEATFSGRKKAEAALKSAVARGNALLREFAKANR